MKYREAYREIGNRIRSIRRSKGITATHVAKKLGYKSVSSYTRYETQSTMIPLLIAKRIADVLGVSIEDFFSPEFTRLNKMCETEKGGEIDERRTQTG